jgi:hypothetical protein
MEAIAIIVGLVTGFLFLDVAATLWGVDSRDPFVDDHRR